MKFIYLIFLLAFVFVSCDQMKEKQPDSRVGNSQDVTGDPHSTPGEDDKSAEYKEAADQSYESYKNDQSESNKETAIKSNLEAGMYFMYDAPLAPREKYRPALKFFRRVLQIDPGNKEATVNKEKIEEIYEMMGMEIPETEL